MEDLSVQACQWSTVRLRYSLVPFVTSDECDGLPQLVPIDERSPVRIAQPNLSHRVRSALQSGRTLGVVAALALLCQHAAFAQLSPGVLKRASWALDAKASSTPISTKQATEPRWYLIFLQSPLKSGVEIIADGVVSNNPVNFSGSALVWGKQVELRRYSGADSIYGFWSILDPQKIESAGTPQWTIFPEVNGESVIAMLNVEREFILTFNQDAKQGDCQNGKLKPIVDNKVLTDAAGKDIILSQGGSILTKGKFVRATVSGTCAAGIGFSGRLDLL